MTQASLEGALKLLQEIEDAEGGTDLIQREFRVQGDAASYLRLLSEASFAAHAAPIRHLRSQLAPSKVVDYLVANVDAISIAEARAVQAMTKIESDWPWGALLETISLQLSQKGTLTPENLTGCSLTLVRLEAAQVDQAETVAAELVVNGHVLSHLYDAREHPAAGAACLVLLLLHLPESGPKTAPGNAAAGQQILAEVAKDPGTKPNFLEPLVAFIRDFGLLGEVLRLARVKDAESGLLSHVLRAFGQTAELSSSLTSELLSSYFSHFRAALPDAALDNHLGRLIQEEDLRSHLFTAGFDLKKASLYLRLLDHSDVFSDEDFVSFLWSGLHHLSAEDWLKQLRMHGSVVRIIERLITGGYEANLSREFADALASFMKDLLVGDFKAAQVESGIPELVGALTDDQRDVLLHNLRDEMLSQPDANVREAVEAYGPLLMQSGVFRERSDEVVRRLFTPILERMDSVELKWFADFVGADPQVVLSARKASVGDLRERVVLAGEGEDISEENWQQLTRIAQHLGVSLDRDRVREPEGDSLPEQEEDE